MGGASSSAMNAPVVVPATARHTATVIFLHGLGDTGHGWASILTESCRIPHVKFICPTAPIQSVTLNAGFQMPSWFDIKGLSPADPEDTEGILKASTSLQSMVSEEEKNHSIPANRIILGGFSQGGALAMYSTLTSHKQFAGMIGLSSWLPLHKSFPDSLTSANKNIACLQCHGMSDPVVPITWGQKTSELLKTFNEYTDFKAYPGLMHSSCPEEMQAVKEFIEKYLPPV